MKHYTLKEVRELLKKHNRKEEDFNKFINGQGCPIVDGELCFWKDDVDRFIKYYEYDKKSK